MPLPCTDPDNYQALLAEKLAQFKLAFAPFAIPEPEVFPSAPEHYRLRAEFRVWHQDDDLHYAMFDPENPKQPVMSEDFPVAAESICGLMPRLVARLPADILGPLLVAAKHRERPAMCSGVSIHPTLPVLTTGMFPTPSEVRSIVCR